jgi:hypothetical protein
MSELRELRRSISLGQGEFAALLSSPLETFRRWDSGRRLCRGAATCPRAVANYQRQHERLPLHQLARELHAHVRTLQAAVRTGRLDAHFSERSTFGRPQRFATRPPPSGSWPRTTAASAGQAIHPAPLPMVPSNYDQQLSILTRLQSAARYHALP